MRIRTLMVAFLFLLLGGIFFSPLLSSSAMADTKIDDTVVTATRTPVSLKDAPGAVTIITAEELQDIPANDVLDIIRETAGVSLIGRGVGGRSVMSIRGLNAWHALILIDGKRVAASDPVFGHSDFEYNWIPLEEIERRWWVSRRW